MTRISTPASSSAAPIKAPWIWLGSDLARDRGWVRDFTAGELAELSQAGETARGIALDALTPERFPLPVLGPELAAIGQELARGRGFVLLRGLAIADLSEDEIATIYCGIGAHIGVNVSQSAAGDRLGHVIDRGGTDRYYTRGGELEFHMDPVDIVGLLCLRAAVKGGASRIVSSMQIHNVLLAERPDLLAHLYRGYHHSRRSHGDMQVSPRIPVFSSSGTDCECYHLPITIRQAVEQGASITAAEQEALDVFAEVASRPQLFLDMDFREGDIQFLNNRHILHARTDYVDHPDPALKRHLLRLWLMVSQWPPRANADLIHRTGDRAGGGIKARDGHAAR